MDFLPEEFEEILNIFRSETEEIIQKMNNNLLQLETSPNNKELLVYLFRDAHSLKGAARMIGFNNIQRLAHKAEDVLGMAKENKIVINREIIDALYRSTDLLSELIQESVKLKKEYYTDDIQKQIDYIDELLKSSQIPEDKTPQTEESKTGNKKIAHSSAENKKTKAFAKKAVTINALLSEASLMLQNMAGQEGSSYIETFEDIIKQLSEQFEDTRYFDIKNEIKNIEAKISFVMHNSNIMTEEEIKELDDKLTNIVNFLNKIYQELEIERFDLKGQLSKKLKSDEQQNAQNLETPDDNGNENSVNSSFIEKIDFIKDGLNKLENNLSQIPALHVAIDALIELSNKKEVADISHKLEEILNVVKNSNNLPEKEVINILKQSFSSVEKLILDTKEEEEDVSLVLQRLDIIKQMLDLNSSINPLSSLSTTLDESSLPVKKAQDFFNSFETTSIRTLRVDSKKLDRLVN